MRVRCIKLLDSHGQSVERSAWAKIGTVYHVWSIATGPGYAKFRIQREETIPALYAPEEFELVSAIIPSTWVASSPNPGHFALQPEPWARPGFWEEYYDADPKARACFE